MPKQQKEPATPDADKVSDGAFSTDNAVSLDHMGEMERIAAEERVRLHKAGKDHNSGFPTVPEGVGPTSGGQDDEKKDPADDERASFTFGSTAESRTDAPLRDDGEALEPSPRQEEELRAREDAATVPAKKVPAKKTARGE